MVHKCIEKHCVFVDHYVIIKKYKEEMNSLLKGEKERYLVKERPNIFVN